MLIIPYCFASLVTASIVAYLLMKLGTYIAPALFGDNRDFMPLMAVFGLIVIAVVNIFFGIPLWVTLVPLIGFTILYPVIWAADARLRKIEKWELITGVGFYLIGVASTVISIVNLLGQ